MSKIASSPTARLLQSSRLFSLPRPLPIQPDLTSGLYRTSETATTAHPTHQAITTPASSLARGDWGLKRPIPSKKTNSKKRNPALPVIRVRANDTYEHITDFESAGDHVQTERKWAEMGIPMIHPLKSKYRQEGPVSVFEEWLDNTDPKASQEGRTQAGGRRIDESPRAVQRWKYDGPWLAGMQDGEFEEYLYKEVHHGRSSRSTWPEFLSKKLYSEKLEQVRRRARNPDNQLDQKQVQQLLEEVPKPLTERLDEVRRKARDGNSEITQEEVEDMVRHARRDAIDELRPYEKRLRDEHASEHLSSDLTALICEYLDLPSVYAGRTQTARTQTARLGPMQALQASGNSSSAADSGPPTTHPSAGLSHLRTNAVMYNHPIHGPQKERPAIESRVVRPRTRNGAVLERKAKLGVGGVVADDSVTATIKNPDPRTTRDEDKMAHALDENVVGGNKIWVHAESAYIDHKSRIQLAISRAGQEAVAVKTGDEEKIKELYQMKKGQGTAMPAQDSYPRIPEGMMSRRPPRPSSSSSSNAATAVRRRYSGVEGFDAEMARST